jgi:hypothetical protein
METKFKIGDVIRKYDDFRSRTIEKVAYDTSSKLDVYMFTDGGFAFVKDQDDYICVSRTKQTIMEEKDLGVFGLGILGAFFGIYANEEKMQEMKAWFGKWVYERGGSEKVWNDYCNSFPQDTPKEKVIETLEECVKEAIKQGAIKEFDDVLFKRDYKIVIQADSNDDVFWYVIRKGEKCVPLTDKELCLVSEMVNEIGEKLKSVYK